MCNYGGRVTDNQDRRLIRTMLTDFYLPDILKDDYLFCKTGKKYNYFAPEEMDFKEYIEWIKGNLPRFDHPDIFGLHTNAEISSALMEKSALL
jgi:dynein heavy chain